ncbi:MAG: site-2 protease family protein [Minisyncoccia bacterium]
MALIVFEIIILIFSAVIHEVSHGFMAEKLGDPTARLAGRLTLNPLKHLDPFGSILLPLMLSLIPGGIVFGWAKPVPYNPYNLKNPEKGAALIAAAGPLSNLSIAAVLSIVFHLLNLSTNNVLIAAQGLVGLAVIINIALAVFNLVPIPPLDGAKVMMAVLPDSAGNVKSFFEERNPYGWILLLAFIFIGMPFISPLISFIAKIFLGV